jgi:hypothetical protein
VLSLLVVIGSVGAVSLAVQAFDSPGTYVLGLLISIAFVTGAGLGLSWCLKNIRERRTRGVEELQTIAAFDRSSGMVLGNDGSAIASIDGAHLQKRMQVASSSRALHLVWHGGSICLARGTPFSGSVGPIEEALYRAVNLPR